MTPLAPPAEVLQEHLVHCGHCRARDKERVADWLDRLGAHEQMGKIVARHTGMPRAEADRCEVHNAHMDACASCHEEFQELCGRLSARYMRGPLGWLRRLRWYSDVLECMKGDGPQPSI